MSTAKKKTLLPENKKLYKFPSRFGSHSSMVNEEKTSTLKDTSLVVLEDEFGEYTTERNRLDSGLADPNRYALARIDKLFLRGEH